MDGPYCLLLMILTVISDKCRGETVLKLHADFFKNNDELGIGPYQGARYIGNATLQICYYQM